MFLDMYRIRQNKHCVKSVGIRSFSGPHFLVFSPNVGEYGPEKPPNMETRSVGLRPISDAYLETCQTSMIHHKCLTGRVLTH